MAVNENIRRIRKEKELTQKQLGELCEPKIAEANIRKYELGNANPKIETLERIAKALGVPLSDLYGDFLQEIEESKNVIEELPHALHNGIIKPALLEYATHFLNGIDCTMKKVDENLFLISGIDIEPIYATPEDICKFVELVMDYSTWQLNKIKEKNRRK